MAKTQVTYLLRSEDWPMWDSNSFKSPEEAIAHYEKEYTNRNKGDGHDEYWRNKKYVVEKRTVIIEDIAILPLAKTNQ